MTAPPRYNLPHGQVNFCCRTARIQSHYRPARLHFITAPTHYILHLLHDFGVTRLLSALDVPPRYTGELCLLCGHRHNHHQNTLVSFVSYVAIVTTTRIHRRALSPVWSSSQPPPEYTGELCLLCGHRHNHQDTLVSFVSCVAIVTASTRVHW